VLDDKIDQNRRTNRALEEMASARFRSWFLDFDPVVAKVAGRTPFGMDAATASLFPFSFEDSSMGFIPRGWTVGKICDIAQNIRRGVRPKDLPPDTPYIGLDHMPRKRIALEAWGHASDVGSGKFVFQRGDILFGKLRPYFHKVGVAPVDGVCSTDVLVVTPRAPAWFGLVLGHLSSEGFVVSVDAASSGTRMPRTNWQTMARYEIAIPPIEVAQALADENVPLVDGIVAGIHECRTLAALRDTLLPSLLSGESQIRDDDRAVESVA